MEEKLVSIIVAVYNAKNKLNRCVESLLAQTYTNIEIILIDDKSPDRQTIDIEECWQKRDARIRLFRNEVNGKPDPRMRGISEAKGTYICFSDQDDWMPKDAIANMVIAIKKNNVDVVIGQVKKAIKVGPFKKEFEQKINLDLVGKVLEKKELMSHYFYSYFGWNILPVSVWGKMYTRDLLVRAYDDILNASNISTGAGDLMMSMTLHPYINRLCVIESDVYSYFIGIPGISPKYLKTWLPLSNNLFAYKWEMLDRYDFHVADRYLAIEMINYLKSFVRTCTIFAPDDKQNHISVMDEVINNPLWQRVECLLNTDYVDQGIVPLILNKETGIIYEREEHKVLTAPLLTRIKNWLNKSLVHFKS